MPCVATQLAPQLLSLYTHTHNPRQMAVLRMLKIKSAVFGGNLPGWLTLILQLAVSRLVCGVRGGDRHPILVFQRIK